MAGFVHSPYSGKDEGGETLMRELPPRSGAHSAQCLSRLSLISPLISPSSVPSPSLVRPSSLPHQCCASAAQVRHEACKCCASAVQVLCKCAGQSARARTASAQTVGGPSADRNPKDGANTSQAGEFAHSKTVTSLLTTTTHSSLPLPTAINWSNG